MGGQAAADSEPSTGTTASSSEAGKRQGAARETNTALASRKLFRSLKTKRNCTESGHVAKDGQGAAAQAGRDQTRKAKVQHEVQLASDMKDSNSQFRNMLEIKWRERKIQTH